MSTAGRTASESTDAASDLAAAVSDASFVRVVAHADGDALAAGGMLARVLSDVDRPFQVSLARTRGAVARRVDTDAEATTVVLGAHAPEADAVVDGPTAASVVAFDAARELGVDPDPTLALAGVVAHGTLPGADGTEHVLDAARDAGVERRAGVGIPTADIADGLAHTTLAHASFSGDAGATQATLAELDLPVDLDESAHRTVASLFALDATGGDQQARAADAVERALHPHALPDGPFATVEGYADVLDAVARWEAGTGIALALGHDVRTAALDAWREHATAAHQAVRTADLARYSGVVVARVPNAPVWTVARLLRDFRSPEPVALAVSDGEAAAAGPTDVDVASLLAAGTDDDRVGGTGGRAYARFDQEQDEEFVDAVREAA
ncbi:exonuclease RecJ [Halobacteriaceae archaeon GCM10025711]